MLAIRICGGQPFSRSITLKADIADLEALNTFIVTELDSAHCPQESRAQIELAAEEVFVNIARYAYSDGAGGSNAGEVLVNYRLVSSPETMTMTLVFKDWGIAFDPLEHPDPDINLPLEEREPGGMGILIVKKTMDTIAYSREDGVNRFEFSKSWHQIKEGT
jgi:anti-sigma regulatory factor (Ser/Thr protein kinase)